MSINHIMKSSDSEYSRKQHFISMKTTSSVEDTITKACSQIGRGIEFNLSVYSRIRFEEPQKFNLEGLKMCE